MIFSFSIHHAVAAWKVFLAQIGSVVLIFLAPFVLALLALAIGVALA